MFAILFAGCGGSTMYVISELEKRFGWEKLSSWRVLLLNAGGQSQRLPSASILGKIFGALPMGDPMYQMLDIKLASYLPFLKRMAPGIFHGPSDTVEVYSLGSDNDGKNLTWDLVQPGFTALAHPSSLKIGTGHGVFVLEETSDGTLPPPIVENRLCRQVLQKPSVETMRQKKGVIKRQMGDSGDGEFVYTDSAFSFDHGVSKKLLEFYRAEEPLNCEIDAYGDFLQALGTSATVGYTSDTRHVGKVEDNLVKMREKIYHLLKGTPLSTITLNKSAFHHFGTVSECLDHFCEDTAFSRQMEFQNWVSSKLLPRALSGDGPAEAKRAKIDKSKSNIRGCVMASALHEDSIVHDRSVVEFCNFEIPVTIQSNCLVSNCAVRSKHLDRGETLVVPANTFLHTVPVIADTKTKYVTVVFGSQDDLKKRVSIEHAAKLSYCGKSFGDFLEAIGAKLGEEMFTGETFEGSLWNAKLFPLTDTMSQSFRLALERLGAMNDGRVLSEAPEVVSMADVMRMKNVPSMLKYRDELAARIAISS